MIFDETGMGTFLRTGSAILTVALVTGAAVGYLRPAVRLWRRGQGDFPLFGVAASGLAIGLVVVGIGYVYAYKPTRDVEGPTVDQRARQIEERESREIPVKQVNVETLEEKAKKMTDKSKTENEERKKAFRERPE